MILSVRSICLPKAHGQVPPAPPSFLAGSAAIEACNALALYCAILALAVRSHSSSILTALLRKRMEAFLSLSAIPVLVTAVYLSMWDQDKSNHCWDEAKWLGRVVLFVIHLEENWWRLGVTQKNGERRSSRAPSRVLRCVRVLLCIQWVVHKAS